jgi:hypothetical protein
MSSFYCVDTMPLPQVRSAEPLTRAEFERQLKAWLTESNEAHVGEFIGYGGKPWLWVRQGSGIYHLNADTKRAGVEEYVRMVSREPSLGWTVTPGRAGKMTKVVFGQRMVAIPGFYFYRKA